MKYQQINLFKLKCIQATQFIDVDGNDDCDDGDSGSRADDDDYSPFETMNRKISVCVFFARSLSFEHLMHLNLKQNNLWWGHLNKKLQFMHIWKKKLRQRTLT